MRKIKIIVCGLLFVSILSACSRPADAPLKTDEQLAAATATAQANIANLPEGLPIREDGVNYKFAAENTYITYEVLGTVDEIVAWYRTELEANNWEKKSNSSEQPLGGALTLLRSKPEMNVSVTIQSIPESEYVRVLITVIPR